MSNAYLEELQSLLSGLDDSQALMAIDVLKQIASNGAKQERGGIKLGVAKGKIIYPEHFDDWDDEVQALFDSSL